MRLFDSHSHLDDDAFDKDRAEVLARAREAGVVAHMVAGITEGNCPAAVALAEAHPGVFASVGVHPHDAKSVGPGTWLALEKLAAHPRVKAWGETGLDFDRMFSPREVQEARFSEELAMAGRLGLPVILHERSSGGRLLEILAAEGPEKKGVVHCFSGTRDELFRYLDLGYAIGVTGILTHKERGRDLRAMIGSVPADRLLLETDAPYLTPSPMRNKHRRNEPAFVAETFRRLAEIRGEDPEAFAETLFQNTLRVFGISEDELGPGS